jgi:hypothetical protein
MYLKIVISLFLCLFCSTFTMAQTDSINMDELEFSQIRTELDSPKANSSSRSASTAQIGTKKVAYPPSAQETTLLAIFVSGFFGGLAALLMPCIFPMLPLTVSFFTKGAEKSKAVSRAVLYGFFIILIYVVLGFVDDKTDLAPEDIVVNSNGKSLTTIGKKWSDLQASKFKSNSQPFYVLLYPNSESLLATPQGADYDIENYRLFLNSGLQAFRNKVN